MNSVLLIVPDLGSLKKYQASLEALGVRVITATSGLEGIEKFNQFSIDLVIIDHAMSGFNGEMIAQYIRCIKKDTPIVGLSRNFNTQEESFDLVINRPDDLHFLINSLQTTPTSILGKDNLDK